MPPKNKKQLEEEAKRLQQERLKRQEQERLLEQERKKYAAEKITTGLILPISNQLLCDFVTKQSAFIQQKITQVLKSEYSNLKDQRITKRLVKQFFYHLKNLRKLFQISQKQTYDERKQDFLKVRVCCGMFLAIYFNNNPSLIENAKKSKQEDQSLLKKLMIDHSQSRQQNQQKVFERKQVLQVLNYFKQHYFDHFLVLHRSLDFAKRQDEKSFNLYIAAPCIEFNSLETKFVDLSLMSKNQHVENNNNHEEKIAQ